jgi:hypothetical protein
LVASVPSVPSAPARRQVTSVIGLAFLFVVVAAGIVILQRGRDGGRTAPSGDSVLSAEQEEAAISATLFFARRDGAGLISAVRRVFAELARGPEEGGAPVLPPDVALVRVFRDGEGGLVLDMNSALLDRHSGGSTSELLTVRALMETMAANFPEIRTIQILVEGRVVESIAGHVAIDGPLVVRR